MDKSQICAFTGHRPASLPWGENEKDGRCVELKGRLFDAVSRAYGEGYRHFICGMAMGADFYFCEAVIALRRQHPDVILEAAIPFIGQSDLWDGPNRRRYRRLLDQCDMETMVGREYNSLCMFRRNAYMVEHASLLIAVFNGSPVGGGTLSTLNYAMNLGVRTDILDI